MPDASSLREASASEAYALMELERAANLASLGHVFPPSLYPYPEADVLARWALVLEATDVTVLVLPFDVVSASDTGVGGLAAVTAYDESTLRHLVVHPSCWGTGLGKLCVGAAVDGIAAHGSPVARLWCLVENHRARGLYEHLGWAPTGQRREAVFPPHPEEMEYARTLSGSRVEGPLPQ